MIKKIFSFFICCAMFLSSCPVLANNSAINYLPYWSSPDTNDTFYADSKKIERIYDVKFKSFAGKITALSGKNLLKYVIPKEKIAMGHTYTVKCKIRTEVTNPNWLNLTFGNKNSTPYTPQWTNGGWNGDDTYSMSGVSFDSNNSVSFGLANTGETVIYIDDVVAYDESDEKQTNIIENGDFSIISKEEKNNENLDFPFWSSPDLGSNFVSGDRNIKCIIDSSTKSYAAKITAASGWNLLRYTIPESKLIDGHTYTLECYIRTEVGAQNWLNLSFGNKKSTPYTPQWTTGKTYKQTGISFSDNQNINFGLANTGATVIYIDDVKVYDEADSENTNILTNGDFEMYGNCAGLQNLHVEPAAGSFAKLKWEPLSDLVEKITVTDNNSGSTVTTDLKVCEQIINLYDNLYDVKITAALINGDEKVYNLSGEVENKYVSYVPEWNDTSYSSNGDIDYTMEIVEDGIRNRALKIDKLSKVVSNTVVSLTQYIRPEFLQSGHTYRMEFDTKMESDYDTWSMVRFGTSWADHTAPYSPHCKDWKHYTLEKTLDDASVPLVAELQCAHNPVTAYFDNVVVYDITDDNKTNLLLNGDFETENPELTLNNIRLRQDGENTIVAWDYPSNKVTSIVAENAETNEMIAILDNSEIDLNPNITDDFIMNFKIYNTYGGYEEKKIAVSNKIESSIVSKPEITIIDNSVTVEATASNSKNGGETTLLLTAYRDGQLVYINSVHRLPGCTIGNDCLKITWQPQEAGKYHIKAFAWTNFLQMKAYYEVAETEFEKIKISKERI